jgi:hypothetical protein
VAAMKAISLDMGYSLILSLGSLDIQQDEYNKKNIQHKQENYPGSSLHPLRNVVLTYEAG